MVYAYSLLLRRDLEVRHSVGSVEAANQAEATGMVMLIARRHYADYLADVAVVQVNERNTIKDVDNVLKLPCT